MTKPVTGGRVCNARHVRSMGRVNNCVMRCFHCGGAIWQHGDQTMTSLCWRTSCSAKKCASEPTSASDSLVAPASRVAVSYCAPLVLGETRFVTAFAKFEPRCRNDRVGFSASMTFSTND